jgi:hypothetical protein
MFISTAQLGNSVVDEPDPELCHLQLGFPSSSIDNSSTSDLLKPVLLVQQFFSSCFSFLFFLLI